MKKFHSDVLRRVGKSSLALAVAAAGPAFAQEAIRELPTAEANAQSEDSYQVEQSTQFVYTQPLLDTAKTITVVPQAVIKDRGVENLADALRSVSGISLAAGEGGTPTGDALSIRGFDARTDIFVDGVRDIAGYYRDTYNVEAVEVSKGPSGVVAGRGSTGGSINLQSKTAFADDASDVALRVGSEGDYRATADINKPLSETSALRVNLLHEDSDTPGRDETFSKSTGVAASLATGLGTARRFNFNAEYLTQENLPDFGMPWVSGGDDTVAALASSLNGPPPVPFSNFYGNVYRDYEDIDATSVTAKYEQDLSDNVTFRVMGRAGKVARESVVTAPRFLDTSATTDVRLSDEKTRDQENALQVLQAAILGQYQTGSVRHNVVAGVELSREVEKRWTFDDLGSDNLDVNNETVDLYNPNARVPFTGNYRRVGNNLEATGDNIALYVFDTITLNPKWELGLGLRSDSFDTEYYYDYDDPNAKIETSDTLASWNASLVFKPAANGSIYFGAGNSFNPAAEDLTATKATANVKPEEAESYELGTKWQLYDQRLLLNAALFHTRKIDAALSQGRDLPTVQGDQKVEGFELSTTGQITDAWSVLASYTHQKAEISSAAGVNNPLEGVALARAPEHSASLWTRYDFSPQWSAGLGVQYIDERFNSASASSARVAPDYTLLEMMIAYELSANLSFQLNGTNITDEEYIDEVGGGHFIPGEGQHYRLTGRYRF